MENMSSAEAIKLHSTAKEVVFMPFCDVIVLVGGAIAEPTVGGTTGVPERLGS
jgi:hypothetical protein